MGRDSAAGEVPASRRWVVDFFRIDVLDLLLYFERRVDDEAGEQDYDYLR
jgi:hypothetical protein